MNPQRLLLSPLLGVALLAAPPGWGSSAGAVTAESVSGREAIVHVPARLPPVGARALVIVLHGGLGNAQRIASAQSESGLNLDAAADRNGFVVAYLNGTPVTRFLGADKLGWNAGNCCGVPAQNNVDDVAYIQSAVQTLAARYGIDRSRVYGLGHSNGGMMVQRLMCETRLLAAGIPISGPLGLEVQKCPAAHGARILAIHGEQDENVPVAGGRGTKGLSGATFSSEQHSRQVFVDSGAAYELLLVAGADHFLNHIDAALQRSEGHSIADKAVAFFGLAAPL